jgi:hypothetical protein
MHATPGTDQVGEQQGAINGSADAREALIGVRHRGNTVREDRLAAADDRPEVTIGLYPPQAEWRKTLPLVTRVPSHQ